MPGGRNPRKDSHLNKEGTRLKEGDDSRPGLRFPDAQPTAHSSAPDLPSSLTTEIMETHPQPWIRAGGQAYNVKSRVA